MDRIRQCENGRYGKCLRVALTIFFAILNCVPILKPEKYTWKRPPLKVHMRKEGGLSICGLMYPDGESTEEPDCVTCER
jgi:hypothetical protein